MIVVDSSVWIDYFRGETNWRTDHLDSCLGREPLLIGDIILTEVLQGFKAPAHFRRALNLLRELDYADMLGKRLALRSAHNYRALREQGVTVRKTIAVMIGTFCIEHDHVLLHSDRDFDPMAKHLGLKVAART